MNSRKHFNINSLKELEAIHRDYPNSIQNSYEDNKFLFEEGCRTIQFAQDDMIHFVSKPLQGSLPIKNIYSEKTEEIIKKFDTSKKENITERQKNVIELFSFIGMDKDEEEILLLIEIFDAIEEHGEDIPLKEIIRLKSIKNEL